MTIEVVCLKAIWTLDGAIFGGRGESCLQFLLVFNVPGSFKIVGLEPCWRVMNIEH